MSSLVGRGLPAALAIAAVIGGNTAAIPPAAAQTTTYDIIIHTGDYRTSSASGMPGGSTTGGTVAPPLPGVAYDVYDTGNPPALVGDCTTDDTGTCTVAVPPGTYTVKQVSAPGGYFLNPILGTGLATGPGGGPAPIVASDYSTYGPVTVSNADVNVPMPNNFATSPDTVRSDLWAVSRNNPSPPARCARNLALLFDLSASITATDLRMYKNSAEGFVQALLGSNTNVTVFTFGTVAGTPGNTTFTGNTSDATAVDDLVAMIDQIALPPTVPVAQYTNWDDGIWQIVARATSSGTPFDEAFVLTDGDPTAFGNDGGVDTVPPAAVSTRFRDVENGIFSANALKRQGTRIVAVGLQGATRALGAQGNTLPGSIANLEAISGQTQSSDYFLVPFDSLLDELPSLAVAGCASLSLTKTPDPATYTQEGQTITYTYTVTNTAPSDGFTVTGITVADPLTGGCTIGDLAPGQSRSCTATYTIQPGDVTNGSVTNTANASGTANGVTIPSNDAPATVLEEGLELTKSVEPSAVSKAGDTVTYTYTVTNTGDVAVDNIAITDTSTGTGTKPTITCQQTSLAVGASTTCTATYTVTAEDIAAGHIDNSAVANGTGPNGEPVTSNKATATVNVEVLKLTKSVKPGTVSKAGDTVTYTYTVTNAGDVAVDNIAITDTSTGTGTKPTITCQQTSLAVGASTTCTATYTVTAADIAAGHVDNTAVANGTGPNGEAVTSNKATATVKVPVTPAPPPVKPLRPIPVTG